MPRIPGSDRNNGQSLIVSTSTYFDGGNSTFTNERHYSRPGDEQGIIRTYVVMYVLYEG